MEGGSSQSRPMSCATWRSTLLKIREDDFTWLLKWLKREKNCEPSVYRELTRTPAMQQKIRGMIDGARDLDPSTRTPRMNQRRRRHAAQKTTRNHIVTNDGCARDGETASE